RGLDLDLGPCHGRELYHLAPRKCAHGALCTARRRRRYRLTKVIAPSAITSVPPAPPHAAQPPLARRSSLSPALVASVAGSSSSAAPLQCVRPTVSCVTRWIHGTTLSA